MNHIPFGIVAGLAVLSTQPAVAAPDSSTYLEQSKQLSQIRADISVLQEEIREERSATQNQMLSLRGQKNDVELQLRRQEALNKELEERIAELSSQEAPKTDETDLDNLLYRIASDLKEDIAASLPYRHQERIESIDEILEEHKNGSLTSTQVATRLWSVAEDENRLNSENQFDSFSIQISGKDVLVDVIRFGMIGMLYHSQDGSFGVWSGEKGWTTIENPARSLGQIFAQFQKGIRSGIFEIPLYLESL